MLDTTSPHRPRNVGWARAAALLYRDWGTSKAYVIGLAFVAAGFSSLPIILAVCALTGLVGYNYVIVGILVGCLLLSAVNTAVVAFFRDASSSRAARSQDLRLWV